MKRRHYGELVREIIRFKKRIEGQNRMEVFMYFKRYVAFSMHTYTPTHAAS